MMAPQTGGAAVPGVEIGRNSGVQVSALRHHDWPGIRHAILKLQWTTEPGWVELAFAQPTLCVVVHEIGGRCELRVAPDRLDEGEYFGPDHVTFAGAGEPITVYAAEMRQVQLACCLFHPHETNYLTAPEAAAIGNAQSRYMFRSGRLHTCANLLNDCGGRPEQDQYAISLSRALIIAMLEVALDRRRPALKPSLPQAHLRKVFQYISDNMDRNFRVEELQRMTGMSASKFARAFRNATGLSPHRWLMDARVRGAQRLMIDDPAGSLAEVAALAGFSDQSHFSRAFLETVGVTPAAWLHDHR
jgi:AraC family transcriptional regulator